jgi:hypothetical protein
MEIVPLVGAASGRAGCCDFGDSASEFGLDPAAITAEFAFYTDRFDVPVA